jgi:hypothetical protein
MLYRGYDVITGWPLGKPVRVLKNGECIKEFPFETKDETILDWIDAERRKQL